MILPSNTLYIFYDYFNSTRQQIQQKQRQIADVEAAKERLAKDHGEMCVKLAQVNKVYTEEKQRNKTLAIEYV